MKRFLIQREMDGIGSAPMNDLNNAGKGSEEVLEAMRSEGKNIQQEQSYVLGNSIFCVYLADSEDLINEHSKLSGTPVTKISEITAVIKHNTSFVSQKAIFHEIVIPMSEESCTILQRTKWDGENRTNLRQPVLTYANNYKIGE